MDIVLRATGGGVGTRITTCQVEAEFRIGSDVVELSLGVDAA